MKVTNKIKIHLDDLRMMPPIDVMQGDAYTRELEFSLYSGSEAWEVPEGVSVAVAYHGASGQGIYDTLPDDTTKAYSVSGNVVTVHLIPQVAAVAGRTMVTVLFTDEKGKQLATFGVIVQVAPNPAIGAGKPKDYINLWDWIGAQAVPEAGISFVSSADEVTVSMRGSGIARIFGGTNYQAVELSEDSCEVTIDNPFGTIRIDGVAGITELDLHGQRVRSFTAEVECGLRKLVLYHNSLTELDCSNCKNLQFLHIHNNPVCDDDAYKDNLIACMRSLPNRGATSTGSIILYPWYGLEVLICKDTEGNYIKYPTGFSVLTFEEGRLYGVVEDGSITYYTFEGGSLQLHTAMNRHHALRKRLETDICLKKNWIFGSAIMYDEAAWAKCPWDFRYNHIADLWETAEKGFGLTFGGLDKYTNTLTGFKHFNVKDYCMGAYYIDGDGNYVWVLAPAIDYTDGNNAGLANYDNFLAGNWTHGDYQLSMLFGNGEEENGEIQRFGYVPNACCCLVDNTNPTGGGTYQNSWPVIAEYFSRNCHSVNFSISIGGGIDLPETRNLLGVFGESNILTNSAGNGGDGKPYTAESNANYSVLTGNYTVKNVDGSTVEKPSSALFIGATAPDKSILGISQSSIEAVSGNWTRSSYLCNYGDGVFGFNNHSRKQLAVTGTSFSAPLCNGVLMLMRNLYAKMFPGETSFGKWSNFMNHVRNRWCNHMNDQMDLAVGYGFPDVFAEPYAPRLLVEAPKVEHMDTVTLGDALDISCAVQKYSKQGYTPELKPSAIAAGRNGRLYPLMSGPLSLRLYSNSSQKEPASYTENYFANDIEVDVLPNVISEVDGSLVLSLDTLSNEYLDEEVVRIADTALADQEFTVQFALDLTDKLYPVDVGTYATSRELLYFINGAHVGRLVLAGISYTSGDAYITFGASSFRHAYYSELTEQNEAFAMGAYLCNALDMAKTPYAIITMTCSKNGINYFMNGTHIGHIPNVPEVNIKVSDVFVNKNSLCHDAAGCVRIYNRVLTDEEIIQNTICMLNSHFEEG